MKTFCILLSFLTLSLSLKAQLREIKYYASPNQESSKEDAKFYQEFLWDDASKTGCAVNTYRIDDELLYRNSYRNFNKKVYRDTSIKYALDGRIEHELIFSPTTNRKLFYRDYHFNGTIKIIKQFGPKGINFTLTEYNAGEKGKTPKKIISYGKALLTDSILTERVYFSSDSTLQFENSYTLRSTGKLEKIRTSNYHKTGELFYKEFSSNNSSGLNRPDSLYSYYKSGKLKRKEYYSKPLKDSSSCFAEDGSKIKFTPLFEDAAFPNGENAMLQWLGRNIEYPRVAKEKGLTGIVYASFVVCTDGELCEFEIAKGVHKSMDKSVLQALKRMPKWKPGKKDGRTTRTHFTLPVQFITE